MIMDGNRRFARERGLSIPEGHRAGLEKLKEVLRWGNEHGIEYAIFFAFSTENWNRKPDEVDALLSLFHEAFERELHEVEKEGGRIRFIGDRTPFDEKLQKLMTDAEERTKNNTGCTAVFAVSYGGRAEIITAAQQACAGGDVTEATFANNLWSAGIPDPDIIVRTGGEKRLSGFLTWQSVYSELFFVDTYWPAFSREEFDAILEEYANRERRMGR